MSDEVILTRSHPSFYRDQIYAYPVVSRRANGLSIGLNLSQNRLCNFRCIYCQIESSRGRDDLQNISQSAVKIDLDQLEAELRRTAEAILSGSLFEDPIFEHVPAEKRILRDFAFSGDGEPTLSPWFPEAVKRAVNVRSNLALKDPKLVLITNATRLDRPELQDSLDLLMKNNGEIWAKLDGTTPERYRLMNRSAVPLSKILDNILLTARLRPVIIQTMLSAVNGKDPEQEEMENYCQTLQRIISGGGQIKGVQLYTVARVPAESFVTPLNDEKMDYWERYVEDELKLPVRVFYSR